MVALQWLERKFGGERRKTAIQMDEIHDFRPVRAGNAADLEKFAELLDVVVISLVENGAGSDWGGTYLYRALQKKLNEGLLNAYRKWLREYRNPPNVESLRLFVMEESEDQIATMETFKGVTASRNATKPERGAGGRHRGVGAAAMLAVGRPEGGDGKDTSLDCKLCNQKHGLWACKEFLKLNVEQRWAKAMECRVCFRCLSRTHRGDKCTRSRTCGLDDCKANHHRLLHENRGGQRPKDAAPARGGGAPPSNRDKPKVAVKADSTTGGSQPILMSHVKPHRYGGVSLRTVPVVLRSRDREMRVTAIIDDGSTRTFLNECVAAELQLGGIPSPLVVSVINNQQSELDSMCVKVRLLSDDGEVDQDVEAYTVQHVLGNTKAVDWASIRNEWEHLKGVPFPELPNDAAIDMLIGLDNHELHDCEDEVVGEVGAPVARKIPLGWTCVGPVRTAVTALAMPQVMCTVEEDRLSQLVRRMWEMEDVLAPANMSIDDRKADQLVEDSIRDCGGHYEVRVPWRTRECFIPRSKNMALNRLLQVEKKLKRDPEAAEAYCKVIQSHIDKGYVEEVPEDEEEVTEPPLAYVPHFAVLRPEAASTRVRVVFDASAESDGLSLNDYMYTGPKLQADLVQVLQRFRRYQVAVGCDVAEMYLQVRLHPDEYNAHRFLWRDMQADARVKVYRHLSVMFGLRSSPFMAQKVAKHNAQKHQKRFPLAAATVDEATYMDDGMDSCKTVPVAIQLCKELLQLWALAGMKVHKWLSSSPEVLQSLPRDQWAKTMRPGAAETTLTKTLGLKWEAVEDYFTFEVAPPPPDMKVTKRSFLSKTASLYDPLGIVCPYVVRARVLLQDMWLAGLGWDDPLPAEVLEMAEAWFEELPGLSLLRVPRALVAKEGDVVATEVHTFTDASQIAYGAATYVVHYYQDGTITARLALAKVKIAPINTVSIPRLELMAAVKGLKTSEIIVATVGWTVRKVRFWSDSLDVICWIRGNSRQYKPFVGNRIGEIHRRSDPDTWNHVPTLANPADKLSRGMEVAELLEDAQWWNGPDFLRQGEDHWPPPLGPVKQDPATVKKEARSHGVVATVVSPAITQEPTVLQWKDTRLHPERYSTLVLVDNCRRPSGRVLTPLTSDELQDTEQLVIRAAQQEQYAPEMCLLRQGRPVPKGLSLAPLHPVLDKEGVLRGGSRLQLAEQIPWATRYPIVLPKKHPITRLVVQRAHVAANHAGTNHVLAQLSVTYWIIAARESIRAFEQDCMECRRRRARPASQLMAPLPAVRTQNTVRAFDHVSVDYAGPFFTRQGRGKAQAKRYLCLFGCLSTRAVHLEMAYGLHTDAFLNAFFRMVCRRGLPSEVISDNGTNFVSGERELRELVADVDWTRVQESTNNKGVKWSFNPPSAPHFNGVHEVLVKAAKRALQGVYRAADINDEELVSAICGAEDLMNSRPLTYQSAHGQDLPPLTPNHFIMGQVGGKFAPDTVDTSSYSLAKRWRHVQELVREFWARWLKEWIPTLSPRKKWRQQQPDLKVGDVVLMLSPDTPRGQWPLGRIVATFPGPDGLVRTADVCVRDSVYRRPIVKLCPLEIAMVDP